MQVAQLAYLNLWITVNDPQLTELNLKLFSLVGGEKADNQNFLSINLKKKIKGAVFSCNEEAYRLGIAT